MYNRMKYELQFDNDQVKLTNLRSRNFRFLSADETEKVKLEFSGMLEKSLSGGKYMRIETMDIKSIDPGVDQNAAVYYVHYHGNHGDIYVMMKAAAEFVSTSIEYCQDFLYRLKEQGAEEIQVNQLPDEILNDFDFNRHIDSVREVYKLI